jgi:hypothetical protein
VVPRNIHVIGTAWTGEAIKNAMTVERMIVFIVASPALTWVGVL